MVNLAASVRGRLRFDVARISLDSRRCCLGMQGSPMLLVTFHEGSPPGRVNNIYAHETADKSLLTEAALDQLCLDAIARFKRPRQYRFVDALPKNNYGKVLKTDLRKLLTEPQP